MSAATVHVRSRARVCGSGPLVESRAASPRWVPGFTAGFTLHRKMSVLWLVLLLVAVQRTRRTRLRAPQRAAAAGARRRRSRRLALPADRRAPRGVARGDGGVDSAADAVPTGGCSGFSHCFRRRACGSSRRSDPTGRRASSRSRVASGAARTVSLSPPSQLRIVAARDRGASVGVRRGRDRGRIHAAERGGADVAHSHRRSRARTLSALVFVESVADAAHAGDLQRCVARRVNFFRSAAMCTSTTRVGTPDVSFHTDSRICARVNSRPSASARYHIRRNSSAVRVTRGRRCSRACESRARVRSADVEAVAGVARRVSFSRRRRNECDARDQFVARERLA